MLSAWQVAAAQSTWYVDANAPGPSHDGRGWTTAFVTLDEALAVAIEDDTIRVAQGTYTPDTSGLAHPRQATFTLSEGIVLEGGYAGSRASEPDARAPGTYGTILCGDLNHDDASGGGTTDNAFHVVTALIGLIAPTLDGFTITGGNADDVGFPTGNSAGGGLYTSGPLFVIDCVVRDNSANQGGGMFNLEGSPVLTRTVFVDNTASLGGALMLYGYETETANAGRFGGGPRHGTPNLTDCRFIRNHATDTAGAVWVSGVMEDPTFIDCVLTQNSADRDAGAVYASGGFHLFENCLFTRNHAGRNGGALWTDSIVSVTNATLAYNRASIGGGAFSPAAGPSFTNTVLWGNRDENGVSEAAQVGSRFPPLANHCCVQGWTGLWAGEQNLGTDPLFVPGPRGDYYLSQTAAGQSANSPCVDAGNVSVAGTALETMTTRSDEALDVDITDVGYHFPAAGADLIMGDSDRDGRLDLFDARQFQDCFAGVGIEVPPWCRIFDFALDNDVDLDDVAAFGQGMTGP